MKVLYLTKYSRNGASSRLRSYQFFPLLEKERLAVTVRPFFDENYLKDLYSGNRISAISILKSYLRRFFVFFTIFNYEKVIIEKELFPYFFSWFEKILFYLNVKYMVDYDDAIFHNYDLNNNKLILFLMKNKINNVMKYSGCVLAGNSYLAQRAKDASAKKIIIQPTVIDIHRYKVKKDYNNNKVIIGWIGSPSSFRCIKKITSVFYELFKKHDIELHVVGANEKFDLIENIKYIEWTEETEVDLISKFDIGIMSLEDTPWERGKCAYKLIQYMGCGIPVVASAVGMNKEVVDDGVNGFLVHQEAEWLDKLSLLIEDKTLREQLGKMGRKKVESKFSLEKNCTTLISVLSDE